MTPLSRRVFLVAGAAGTAACGSINTPSAAAINSDVAASKNLLYRSVPGAQELSARASGVLIIPRILEGGFLVSGAYGEGALQIGDATVEYYSMAAAAIGLQLGVQTFAQALFFMTPSALAKFRSTDGWELGVDAEAAAFEEGINFGTSTTSINQPVVQLIYGQRGLIVGASLEGAKYSRLIRS